MTENLRLDLNTNTPITPQYSSVFTSWTPDNNTQTTLDVTWASTSTVPAEFSIARSYTYGSQTAQTYDGSTQYLGNYYNWYAATAGTGTYDLTTQTAVGSICPKGWKLPRYNDEKSFYTLVKGTYGLSAYTTANVNTTRSVPLSFVYSGFYYWYNTSGAYGTVHRLGTLGEWVSSQSYTNTAVNSFEINTNPQVYTDPQYAVTKTSGCSIRCVAQ